MPRPSSITRDAMLDRVLDAAEALARRDGLRGIGMRRIAQEIGYAPGTIYNLVGDLDAVVLRLNARTLARLAGALETCAEAGREPVATVHAMADCYLDFVAADPRVWGLLLEHSGTAGTTPPDWYAEALARATGLVDRVLAPLIPDAAERRRSVATLWAALHGLASLATSGKLAVVEKDDPHDLARLLVSRFLAAAE